MLGRLGYCSRKYAFLLSVHMDTQHSGIGITMELYRAFLLCSELLIFS